MPAARTLRLVPQKAEQINNAYEGRYSSNNRNQAQLSLDGLGVERLMLRLIRFEERHDCISLLLLTCRLVTTEPARRQPLAREEERGSGCRARTRLKSSCRTFAIQACTPCCRA